MMYRDREGSLRRIRVLYQWQVLKFSRCLMLRWGRTAHAAVRVMEFKFCDMGGALTGLWFHRL